jgi:hypothetical protein
LVLELLIFQIEYVCVLLLRTIPFKFNKISRISSLTPGIVENSCVTPAIRTAEIATPPKSPKSTRLN